MSGTARFRMAWIISWFVVGVLVFVPIVSACSWSYVIWAIRSRPADPLFRFVRNGKVGYIESSGKVVIQPTLPKCGTSGGEFHEGFVAIKDDKATGMSTGLVRRCSEPTPGLSSIFLRAGSGGSITGFPNDKFPHWGFIDRAGRFAIAPQYY